MKRAIAYFIAAGLFAAATTLNLVHDGVNLKTGIGAVFFGTLLFMGIKTLREAR